MGLGTVALRSSGLDSNPPHFPTQLSPQGMLVNHSRPRFQEE